MLTMFPVDGVDELVRTGGSTRVAVEVKAGFRPGDRVRAVNINPVTHTRLPQYVRGKIGTVFEDRGVFVFPDTNAQLKGEKPQHVYSVAFTAKDLWGPGSSSNDRLFIDLWEDYIKPLEG